MKVLVIGGTGNVGAMVVKELLKRGAEVRAFSRERPKEGKVPSGIEVALGDLLDPVSLEQAMQGVDKLFLLNAVVPDELTQALIAYGIARRVGVKHLTYLSVFRVDQFRDVPHFASKLTIESALREFGVPYTILRPAYYIQNDASLKDALTGPGIYPMPIGTAGIAAVDVRDIAEAAAISLTQEGHEEQTYDWRRATHRANQFITERRQCFLTDSSFGRRYRQIAHVVSMQNSSRVMTAAPRTRRFWSIPWPSGERFSR